MEQETPTYQNLQKNRSYSNGLDNKECKDTGICKTNLEREINAQMINDKPSNQFEISKLSNVYTNQNELGTSNHTYQNLQEKRSSSNGLDNKDNIDSGTYKTSLKEGVSINNIQLENDHRTSNQLAISR